MMSESKCYPEMSCLKSKIITRNRQHSFLDFGVLLSGIKRQVIGVLVALLWSTYGVPMAYIRLSYGVPMEFHRGSVGAWSGESRERVGACSGGHWGPRMPRIEIRGYETKHPSGVMCRVKNKDTFFLRKMEIINRFLP
jgi:hypothetical protein